MVGYTPKLKEYIAALKRIMAPDKPAVTRCQGSELMTEFFPHGDVSVQGFDSRLWDHEGLIYESGN